MKKVKPCGWQILQVKVFSCSAKAEKVTHVRFINVPLLLRKSFRKHWKRKIRQGNKLKRGQSTRRVAKVRVLSGYQEPHQSEIFTHQEHQTGRKWRMSGTKNLFFVCSHSLRHLTGSNGAVGRPFLSSQHILLGHLHLLQCRSRSLVSRDPAALYLHHLHQCSEEDKVLWMISVSSSHQNLWPIFQASQGRDYLGTLSA